MMTFKSRIYGLYFVCESKILNPETVDAFYSAKDLELSKKSNNKKIRGIFEKTISDMPFYFLRINEKHSMKTGYDFTGRRRQSPRTIGNIAVNT